MKLNLAVQWNYFVMIFAKANDIFAKAKVKVQFYIIVCLANNIIDKGLISLAERQYH